MITTIEEILKNEGFEPFKKYDIDKWIGGIAFQYHITGIMFMHGGRMCLWYQDFCILCAKDELQKFYGGCEIVKIDEGPCIWADSKDEMTIDYKNLRDKCNAYKKQKVKKVLALLKKFAKAYEELDYDIQADVDDAIKVEKNGNFSIILQNMPNWGCYNENINISVQTEITNIYLTHAVNFFNNEYHNIKTHVDLTQAIAVYQCMKNNRLCVCIETSDGKKYHIFKDNNNSQYIALCILYRKVI